MSVNVILSNRDVSICYFLWRWKLATTAAIRQHFYRDTGGGAYQRLLKLEQAEYIRSRFDESGKHSVWVLDRLGFDLIKNDLPELRETSYLPNHWGHDLLVSAIHLGDGLFEKLSNIEFYSEQQLRAVNPEFYPDWVPKIRMHRPDGYWLVGPESNPKTIALEVELTQKRDYDYESVGRSYFFAKVDGVIWIVPKPSLARAIHNQLIKSHGEEVKHHFVLLDPLYEKGWQAPIILGQDTGKVISEILQTCPRSSEDQLFSHVSLDTRKRANISSPIQLFLPN